MRSVITKLGQNPQQSMNIFIKGLALFLVGAALIALGYYQQYWWQIIGIVFLAFGVLVAAWGYLGIFIYRMRSLTNKPRRLP